MDKLKMMAQGEDSSSEHDEGSSSDDDDSREVAAKPKDLCQVCTVEEHKYKCPACLLLTCGL